jgi:hypothetical protein
LIIVTGNVPIDAIMQEPRAIAIAIPASKTIARFLIRSCRWMDGVLPYTLIYYLNISISILKHSIG